MKGLPPSVEKVLPNRFVPKLKSIYHQLYPDQEISHFSHFYREYGHVILSSSIIGSVKPGPNSYSSSVIMAFWPGSGESLTVVYTRMCVGQVQFYMRHSIRENGKDIIHLFAFVYWKKTHPQYNWFGVSATVCSDLFEEEGACCFIPVQRIGARCAFASLPTEFRSSNSSIAETVFIACPIPVAFLNS